MIVVLYFFIFVLRLQWAKKLGWLFLAVGGRSSIREWHLTATLGDLRWPWVCYVEHAWTRMNMNDHCIICISLLSFLEFRDLICMVQSLMLFIFCMTKAGRLAVVALARTTASTWAPENRASPNSMLDQHFSPSTLPKLGVYHDIPHSWTYHPKSYCHMVGNISIPISSLWHSLKT